MNKQLLENTARQIVSKTILAADESTQTIQKRFDQINIHATPENNRQYRQMLFTAARIEEFISGIIMFDETFRQKTDDGTLFVELLINKHIVPGIKVDQGTAPLSGYEPDTYTQGLNSLDDRLDEYRKLHAGFAKWRAVLTIEGDDHPSEEAFKRNAKDLATYAKMCQEHDIVPIVEPEVLMKGNHSIERNKQVTSKILKLLFSELELQDVYIKGVILKPNMVTAGSDCPDQKSADDTAQQTLDVFAQTVPADLPGIAFLSGGQNEDTATIQLSAICALANKYKEKYPWRLTASFGRALQNEALETWKGNRDFVEQAQKIFINRAGKVFTASKGKQ